MAGFLGKVIGLDKYKANNKKRTQEYNKAFRRGLIKAGLLLQRYSMEVVPRDTGALVNTARTNYTGDGVNHEVEVTYSTDYAIYVHEDEEAQHATGKQAKFLSGPLREKRKQLLAVILAETSGAGQGGGQSTSPRPRDDQGRFL